MAAESAIPLSSIPDIILAVLPSLLGALAILLIGWIAGRLIGKGVRIFLDKVTGFTPVRDSDMGKSISQSGVTAGYLGDITARCIVYLIAILGAVDFLHFRFLSEFMLAVTEYIPRVAAFVIILVVGLLLTDYFIGLFRTVTKNDFIELLDLVLFLLRIFLYFIVVMLALSQLKIDLTIIYTLLTPIAWGVGIGVCAAIAIVAWYGLRDRGEQIANALSEVLSK